MITFTNERVIYSPAQSARDIVATVKFAEKAGIKTFYVPFLEDNEELNLEESFQTFEKRDQEETAIWLDFIPSENFYTKVYEFLLTKNIKLINSPEQHSLALKFDLFYPLIKDVTPKSWIIKNITPDEIQSRVAHMCEEQDIKFPVFVKGDIKSNKEAGLHFCVAEDATRLAQITRGLLKMPSRSSGKVIVRELAKLKYKNKSLSGFPFGREYRCFIYNKKIVSLGYYWPENDFGELTEEDSNIINELCQLVASRVDCPFLTVDLGQTEDDKWIVIETGDAQFCGLSQNDGIQLFKNLNIQ